MKVAMVTMNVEVGKCQENVHKMLTYIKKARQESVDLIIFPQNVVSGYLLYDQWMDDAWCRYIDSFNEVLIQESYDIAIVWGNIRYRNKRRFQAAFFAYEGKTHMRVKSNEALAYINDNLYFEESKINSAIEYKGYVMALNFKDDLQIADININIDSYMYDASLQRTWRGTQFYVNANGIQYDQQYVRVLDGNCVYMQDGQCLYASSSIKQEYHIVTLHQQPMISQKPSLYDMLCTSLRLFDEQLSIDKQWVLPITDNIGSMLSAYICTNVLGIQKVIGIVLDDKCPISFYEQLGLPLKKVSGSIEDRKIAYHKIVSKLDKCVIVDTFYKADRVFKHNPYICYPHMACSIIGDLTKEELNLIVDDIHILPKDSMKYFTNEIEDEFVEHIGNPLALQIFFETYPVEAKKLMMMYQEHMLGFRQYIYVLCMHHQVIRNHHMIPTLNYNYLIEKKDLSS